MLYAIKYLLIYITCNLIFTQNIEFSNFLQVNDRAQFERAFAGATVHDMFNWLCVITMLPLEVATGYLYSFSKILLDALPAQSSSNMKVQLLSKITKPVTNRIVQVIYY